MRRRDISAEASREGGDRLLPAYDGIPLPQSPGVLRLLLIGGWYLHALPMGLLLVMLLMLLPLYRGAKAGPGNARRLFREVLTALPFVIGAAILMGTLPLVYLQTLYGAYYFPAVTVMAIPWLAGPLLLAAGYGSAFLLFFKGRTMVRWRIPGLVVMVPSFFLFAFLLVHMSLLTESPHLVEALYRQSRSGLHLAVGRWELWARVLHVLTGAAALGSALVLLYGYARWRWGGASPYGRFVLRAGSFWFLLLVGMQAATGPLFLFSQPPRITAGFLKGEVFWLLAGGVGLASAGWLGVLVARWREAWGLLPWALPATLLSAAEMALNREILRVFRLGRPWFPPALSHPGGLFLVLAGAALAALATGVLGILAWRDWTRHKRHVAGRYRGRKLLLRRG